MTGSRVGLAVAVALLGPAAASAMPTGIPADHGVTQIYHMQFNLGWATVDPNPTGNPLFWPVPLRRGSQSEGYESYGVCRDVPANEAQYVCPFTDGVFRPENVLHWQESFSNLDATTIVIPVSFFYPGQVDYAALVTLGPGETIVFDIHVQEPIAFETAPGLWGHNHRSGPSIGMDVHISEAFFTTDTAVAGEVEWTILNQILGSVDEDGADGVDFSTTGLSSFLVIPEPAGLLLFAIVLARLLPPVTKAIFVRMSSEEG